MIAAEGGNAAAACYDVTSLGQCAAMVEDAVSLVNIVDDLERLRRSVPVLDRIVEEISDRLSRRVCGATPRVAIGSPAITPISSSGARATRLRGTGAGRRWNGPALDFED